MYEQKDRGNEHHFEMEAIQKSLVDNIISIFFIGAAMGLEPTTFSLATRRSEAIPAYIINIKLVFFFELSKGQYM